MNQNSDKIRVQKELIKRDLPDSCYVIRDEVMGSDELRELLIENNNYLSRKALLNANRKLHLELGYSLRTADVQDAYQDAVTDTLIQIEKGGLSFYSPNKFFGYVLLTAWRNIRDEQQKKTVLVASSVEGDMGNLTPRLVPLDAVAAQVSQPRVARGSLDMRDDFNSNLWTGLWESMGEAVLRGQLEFRHVAIYKHYMLHKHIIAQTTDSNDKPSYTIKKMAAEGEFSIKQITKALRIVKKYVADYVRDMKCPEDIDYENEAEDIFGY